MLSYAKLWQLLELRGMKKTDLKKIMSSATLAKLGKNEPISSTVIEKLCGFLKCQPGDIMSYVDEETIEQFATQMDNMAREMLAALKERGVTEEQFTAMLLEGVPEYMKSLTNGGSPVSEGVKEAEKRKNNKE